ncbi:MAG: C40 family peptidase, partial [Symploca sp. SIO2B6]|nr:C40 family peptidase [Symploca sp. SIO2B6]
MVSLTTLIQEYSAVASQGDELKQGLSQEHLSQDDLSQNYLSQQYRCRSNVDVYDSPHLRTLATQAVASRQLRILSLPSSNRTNQAPLPQAIPICLCDDDYPGWIATADLEHLERTNHPCQPPCWTTADIRDRIPAIIAYLKTAMAQPNHYLWGGTIGPNYDCSGLMQAAFRSVNIWLPRDAYQQEPFVQLVPLDPSFQHLQPGDLIFFGPQERANHVALYLGDRHYIHSSGTAIGRNGIGIDILSPEGDAVSQAYLAQVHGAGRVVSSYQPTGTPIKAIDIQFPL